MMKTCRDCDKNLPLDCFYLNGKGGTMVRCKTCNKAKSVAWAKANADRTRQIAASYRERNIEQSRDYGRRWYLEHRERIAEAARERSRTWRAAHRNRHRAYVSQYRHDHPEEVRERTEAWVARNRERINASVRRRRSRSDVRIKRREEAMRRRAVMRAVSIGSVDYRAILAQYGRICHICRGPIGSDLHFDHVIPLSRGGEHSMANIRPAHAFCNLSKADKLLQFEACMGVEYAVIP